MQDKIFPPDEISRLRGFPDDSFAKWKLDILTACGPMPSDPSTAEWLRFARATRASWQAFFDAANYVGLFDGSESKSLIKKLRSDSEHEFLSGLNECMVCWFLAAYLKLKLKPNMRGRGSRVLDFGMALGESECGVEVKSPFRKPVGRIWTGDDSAKIAECMKSANKQFSDNTPNLLVVTPSLRSWGDSLRRDFAIAA